MSPDCCYILKALNNGQFVTEERDGILAASMTYKSYATRFWFREDQDKYLLQVDDERFVYASVEDGSFEVSLVANKDWATRFGVLRLGGGRIALFVEESLKFVSCDLSQQARLCANRPWCQNWEWFLASPQLQRKRSSEMDKGDDLQAFVGMNEVKREIIKLERFLTLQLERKRRGSRAPSLSLHLALLGPPGTGKTTVARIIAKIYKRLGLLKRGHLIETDRAGLVAKYLGQTEAKVDEVVQKALAACRT